MNDPQIDLSEPAEALAKTVWNEEQEGMAWNDLDAGQKVMVKDSVLPLIQAVAPSIAAQAWDAAVEHTSELVGFPNVGWTNPWRQA